MSLPTNLDHVTSPSDYEQLLADNPNVMITCGRMGPMCVPVYEAMDKLRGTYTHVAFRDMAFDSTLADVIRALPQTRHFRGLPFVVYYKDGQPVHATGGIQKKSEVQAILDQHFGPAN